MAGNPIIKQQTMNKIIKSQQAETNSNLIDPFVMIHQSNQKEQENQEQQHRQLLEEAKQLGRDQGYREGYESGMKRAQQEYSEKISQVKYLAQQLKSLLNEKWDLFENLAVSLNLALLKQFILDTQNNRERAKDRIHAICKELKEKGPLKVHISMDDFKSLQADGAFINEWSEKHNIVWIADAEIKNGESYIETDFGDYDARFQPQLENLRRIIES